MGVNTSILTDTAKGNTARSVVDYGAGVFAHVNGDWDKHGTVRVIDSPYLDDAGDVVTTKSLRILATRDDGTTFGEDLALLVPINDSGTNAISGAPPIFIQHPLSTSVQIASRFQIRVAAISDTPFNYFWHKNGELLSGKTAASLVFPTIQTTDSGTYVAFAVNANGTTASNPGVINANRVRNDNTTDDDGGFFEQLPHVRIFNAATGG